MTDKEINIAIAKACGWENVKETYLPGLTLGIPPTNENLNTPCYCEYAPGVACYQIKDYCNDLNAMREAEQKMWSIDWGLRHVFIYELAKLIDPINGYRMREAIDLLDATARQRADALLNAINHRENYG